MRIYSVPRVLYLIKILENIKEYSRPLLASAETSHSKKICLRFEQKTSVEFYECVFLVSGFLVFMVNCVVFHLTWLSNSKGILLLACYLVSAEIIYGQDFRKFSVPLDVYVICRLDYTECRNFSRTAVY